MRTFRITLVASLAGWLAGVLTGTVGGALLAWLEPDPDPVMRGLSVLAIVFSVIRWAFILAVAMVPGSLLFVAPMIFRALGRSSFWHPLLAACVGGGMGIVGMILFFLVVSLFTTPINGSREGEAVHVVALYTATAVAMGAATGWMAVYAARWLPLNAPATGTAAPIDLPPPLPYDY